MSVALKHWLVARVGHDLCALLGRSGFGTVGRLHPTLFCGALHLFSTVCLWFDERCFKTSVGVRVGCDLCALLGRFSFMRPGRLHPTLFCGALHLFLTACLWFDDIFLAAFWAVFLRTKKIPVILQMTGIFFYSGRRTWSPAVRPSRIWIRSSWRMPVVTACSVRPSGRRTKLCSPRV